MRTIDTDIRNINERIDDRNIIETIETDNSLSCSEISNQDWVWI